MGMVLPLNLVSPSGVVAVAGDGQRQIGRARHGDGLAVIERFQPGQLVGVCFDQIRQLVQQSPALRGGHAPPGTLTVECGARGFDGPVDIRPVGLRHLTDLFSRGGIDRRECPAGLALNPSVIDQEFSRLDSDVVSNR